MDNNEKEIEKMATLLCPDYPQGCKDCWSSPYKEHEDCCSIENDVETLCNAGIGDKKQAVKEAFERLKVAICGGIYEDEDVYIENKWYTQKEFVGEIIDELFTELYGA